MSVNWNPEEFVTLVCLKCRCAIGFVVGQWPSIEDRADVEYKIAEHTCGEQAVTQDMLDAVKIKMIAYREKLTENGHPPSFEEQMTTWKAFLLMEQRGFL